VCASGVAFPSECHLPFGIRPLCTKSMVLKHLLFLLGLLCLPAPLSSTTLCLVGLRIVPVWGHRYFLRNSTPTT
jgi:hypothetical protein